MNDEYRMASQLVDRLASQLLVRPHARAQRKTTRCGMISPLLRVARRWPWGSNIVGVAVCEKRCEGRRATGKLAVTFLVQRKLAKARLAAHERIPDTLTIEGIEMPTDIMCAPGVPIAENGTVRPVRPGCVVGHFRGGPGSLGPIVRKIGSAAPLFMGCSHVIARGGLAAALDPIEQPADSDGAPGPNVVGRLTNEFSRLNPRAVNTHDVALAQMKPGLPVLSAFLGGARPTGVAQLEAADLANLGAVSLTRFGAQTGVQPGVLEGPRAAVPLAVPALGPAPIVFGKVGLYRTHSEPGDSGAPIVRASTGELFGIHIGRIGDFGVFFPVKPILRQFGLELMP